MKPTTRVKNRTPVIVCIDAEPDPRLVSRERSEPWLGYEKTFEFFSRMRPRLASLTGAPVRFSWFFRMDPQVAECYGSPAWAVTRYAEYLEDLRKNEDEIGLHTHAWRWDGGRKTWVIDHGDQSWVNHCVEMSFQAFRSAVGHDCRSFRFGDSWMNDETLELVERLGARFDLTPEPGRGGRPILRKNQKNVELTTGVRPDHRRAPFTPYQPSKSDYRRPAISPRTGIWIIPLSMQKLHRGGMLSRFYRLFRPGTGQGQAWRKLFIGAPPADFVPAANALLDTLKIPYLALVVRTSSFLNPIRVRHITENLQYLAGLPHDRRVLFTTPSEAMALMGYPQAA